MTLWYDFGSNNDGIHEGEDFEYDLERSDIEDFFMGLPSEELVDAFEQSFRSLPKEEQIAILEERGEKNFACPNFIQWIEDDKKWVVSEFLMDNEILELFEDDLHDHFEDKAFRQYREQSEEARDPLGAVGMSLKDFY